MAEYIEREALCKILETWRDAHADVDDEYGCGLLEDVLWEVNAQTAADVAPKWISVKDKLPEDGETVLIWYEYFRYGSYNRMFQTHGIGFQYNGQWAGVDPLGHKARVFAWMPLPEPPRMDGAE